MFQSLLNTRHCSSLKGIKDVFEGVKTFQSLLNTRHCSSNKKYKTKIKKGGAVSILTQYKALFISKIIFNEEFTINKVSILTQYKALFISMKEGTLTI